MPIEHPKNAPLRVLRVIPGLNTVGAEMDRSFQQHFPFGSDWEPSRPSSARPTGSPLSFGPGATRTNSNARPIEATGIGNTQ
jgi:hypothetical protein